MTTRQGSGLGLAIPTRGNNLAREAPKAVYELEHYGVPFSRTERGQRFTNVPWRFTPPQLR